MRHYWMENGDLPWYLQAHPEEDRCRISTNICEGLAHLHATNIVHGGLRGVDGVDCRLRECRIAKKYITIRMSRGNPARWKKRFRPPENRQIPAMRVPVPVQELDFAAGNSAGIPQIPAI
ncbi:hypothetical protein BDV93DRAFT_511190 [Ceratobasidium sp. AG-I]|nr:hypothetical protein BDV93DRAFT_511190 [Ceratobasidium sp. AG-I]